MRAFAFEELGGPGSIVEVPVPDPAEGQVRIRVAAAGLNPFDNAVVQGYLKDQMEHRFPLIPSADASGTVEALGDGVTDLSIGDEVFGSVGKMYPGRGHVRGVRHDVDRDDRAQARVGRSSRRRGDPGRRRDGPHDGRHRVRLRG